MPKKHNILIFKDSGFFYGSLEKLLQLLARHLAKEFNVYFAYAPKVSEELKSNLEGSGVTLVPFSYQYRRAYEPFDFVGMKPKILEMVEKYKINCIFTDVFSNFQFPMNSVPASMPFVLISPFGHYATNGNVSKIYVSGQINVNRLKERGIKNAEILYNPLEDFPEKVWKRSMVGETVTFGRIGRGDDSTFDPIALLAFSKLEAKYGSKVKYIVVNPAPAWKKLAESLGVKNIEYRDKLSQEQLEDFYKEIDVFAHARKDGETVGMAIAEAMLSGCPILTHKSRFHNEHFNILDESFARWSGSENIEAYFQNMVYMVEHKNEIRSMGMLARKKAYGIFVIEAQLPGILKTFRQACEKCTYYTQKNLGYVRLYWENFKKLPFWFAKFLLYILK